MLLLIVAKASEQSVYDIRQGSWHSISFLNPDSIFTSEAAALACARRESASVYRLPDRLADLERVFSAEPSQKGENS